MWKIAILAAACCFLGMGHASAQSNVIINCQTGTTSTGAPIYAPASATNPCPVSGSSTGTPTATVPPRLTAYGTLAVTAASVALSTLTVSPNSPAWSTTYPNNYVSIRNSVLSAGVVYVCWLGGTCSASVGDPVAVGQSATRNVGNAVSPTLFAASTATVTGAE